MFNFIKKGKIFLPCSMMSKCICMDNIKTHMDNIKTNMNNKNSNTYNLLKKVHSDVTFKKIMNCLNSQTKLNIIKFNKKFQNKLNIEKTDYDEHFKTIIDLKITKLYLNKFKNHISNVPFVDLKIDDKEAFNENNNNINNNLENKNLINVTLEISHKYKSFENLLYGCDFVEKIYFRRINRRDIKSTKNMFHNCPLLKEINFNNFDTTKVTDMSYMFTLCHDLEKITIDPNHFKTNNVKLSKGMFEYCCSLENVNFPSLNFSNVENMGNMFFGCDNLKNVNLNFIDKNEKDNKDNIKKNTICMFTECLKLKKINNLDDFLKINGVSKNTFFMSNKTLENEVNKKLLKK